MTTQAEFLKALSAAPATPVSEATSIPGLGSGEFMLASLWSITDRLKRAHGGRLLEGIAEQTRKDLTGDDDGPWHDRCTRHDPFKPCLAPGTIRCHRGCG